MKALKIFLTLFCMGVIVSCSKDEPAPAPAKEQPTPQQTNFPTVKSFSAQEVTVGDIITIEGENFNPSQTYTITFNGVKGTIKEVTPNHLKVEIPEESTSGEVILSSNQTSKSIGRLTILPKPSVLYAYDLRNHKIVKLDLQTGKELETIAEIGKEYLGRGIYYLKSTNEIIGIQSGNSGHYLFKLNVTTKEIVRLPCNLYEKLIIANNEPYAYDLRNHKIVKLDLQTGNTITSKRTIITYSKKGEVTYPNNEIPAISTLIDYQAMETYKKILAQEKERLAEEKRLAKQKEEQEKQLEKQRKEREERIEKFKDNCFSAWDGYHRDLVKYVKGLMNDPKSFEHVNTTYVMTNDGYAIINMVYRGRNALGGIVTESIKAKIDPLDCSIIQIIE